MGELELIPGWTQYDWDQIFAWPDGPSRDDVRQVVYQYTSDAPESLSYYQDTDMVAVLAMTDGRWASVHAGNDTTGWGCQGDYVKWYFGDTLEDVIINGLTNESRRWLGLELPS